MPLCRCLILFISLIKKLRSLRHSGVSKQLIIRFRKRNVRVDALRKIFIQLLDYIRCKFCHLELKIFSYFSPRTGSDLYLISSEQKLFVVHLSAGNDFANYTTVPSFYFTLFIYVLKYT